MAIDSDTFDEMFAASGSPASNEADDFMEQPPMREADEYEIDEPPIREYDEIDEPPVRLNDEFEEPPIQVEVPPPTQEELEAAAADELLKIAAEEEKHLRKVRKGAKSSKPAASTATFLIRCPKGCRIRVKEQHRGRSGKCPRCQSEFVVPLKGTKNAGESEK